MKAARGYNTLACLTVFLGILSYAMADGKPTMALLAAPIVAAGWWTARRGEFPWVMPRWVINLLVIVAVLNSVVQVIILRRHDALVSDLSDFLVFIQLIKLFDRRKARDDAQLLALSLFIVIGAILTDNSLAVGLCLLVYTPLATWTIMRQQVHAGQRELAEARRDAGLAPDGAAPAGPGHQRHFRRLTAAAITFSLAASIVIFVLMPRGLGEDFPGFRGPRAGTETGFTDMVDLMGSGLISESQRPVMDVQLFEQGRATGSNAVTLYLRGTVLDRYDSSGQWSRVRDAIENDVAQHAAHVPMTISAAVDNPSELHIRMRNAVAGRGYLFTMWRPIRINPNQTLRVVRADPSGDLVLRYEGARSRNLTTVVEFARDPGVITARRETNIPPRDFSFQNSRIQELALQLLRDRNIPLDPAQRESHHNRDGINAFQQYLRQTCSYTLEQELSPDEPIEWFIFERRRGHCEYFASALVAMCWSVGIDARLVTGYVATEFDEGTRTYVVRESNAHAWVEAELSPGRWVTFDPTPPADLDRIHRARPGLIGQARRFYERLELGWATSIVSFDASRRERVYEATLGQSRILNFARALVESAVARIRGLLSFIPMPTGILQALAYVGVIAVLLAGAWVLTRVISRRLLRSLGRRPTTDPDLVALLRQAGFYREALEILSHAGTPKPAATPPLRHAAALDPAVAADFAALSRLFYQVRFGRHPLSPEESDRAEELLVRLRAALHGR